MQRYQQNTATNEFTHYNIHNLFTNNQTSRCPYKEYKVKYIDDSTGVEGYYTGTDITVVGNNLVVKTDKPIWGIKFWIEGATWSGVK